MGSSRVRIFKLSVIVLIILIFPITVRNEKEQDVLDIGVILDYGSLVGKEARTAMEIAAQDFNAEPRGYELKLHYENSGGRPLDAVFSAENLIKSKKVKAIIGLETWKVAELVAEFCRRYHLVPVISLAGNPSGHATPGLIEMGTHESEQMRCIVDIVRFYNRQRVSVIYEQDMYDGRYPLPGHHLSKELQDIGSEVEDSVVFPRFSLLSDPELVVREKLRTMLKRKSSPIFVVFDLSLPMASYFLKEVRRMRFSRGDSVWVLSGTVLNLLGSVNSTATSSSSMKGNRYSDFRHKFQQHKVGRGLEPGIHSLRAYDSITVVTRAMDGAPVPSTRAPPELLGKMILKSRLDGLSGEIAFNKDGRILNPGKAGVVTGNGAGESLYKDLNTWPCGNMFSRGDAAVVRELSLNGFNQSRMWQREACSVPGVCGSNPMKIILPRTTKPFNKFVREVNDSGRTRYSGFCIDVFDQILGILNRSQSFHYKFYSQLSGLTNYDDMIQAVHNKTYQAAIGDITILANRLKIVDFTQPFIESGLSMIVLEDLDNKTWIFLRPFTWRMWMASGGILICTMLSVWFLEQPLNPEFQGRWTDQLATALWFTFSSLFFAHRERIHRNPTRIVLVVWFFMALILTQSYTASLTSMLTVERLKPNDITMKWLKQHNARVGCHNSTFVCHYLESVQNFSRNAIVGLSNYTDIDDRLKSGSIKAMFVESPYERDFTGRYCSGLSVTHLSYQFAGFGFAFQKGSPWTAKFSEAILQLSESGELERIGDKWFGHQECFISNATTTTTSDPETERLDLNSFWALYVFSIGTCALCLLVSCFCSRKSDHKDHAIYPEEQLDNYPEHEEDHDREMGELHDHGR